MPQPYNYSFPVEDPTKSILSGYQVGASILDLQRQAQAKKIAMAQALQQMQQQQAMQSDLTELSKNPTTQGIVSTMIKYPSLSENLTRAYNSQSTEQKQAHLNEASQVYSALISGQPQIAIDFANKQAEAYRNSGNEKSAASMEDLAKTIETDPNKALPAIGMFVASVMGPDKFSENFSSIEKERRERELQPEEVKKKAAEVGLTDAQAKQALANAQKLSAETQKLLLDAQAQKEGKGVLDPKDRSTLERNLSNDYASQAKTYLDTQDSYRRIKATTNDAAGDLSLIFNYMKMLDPGSVVREGEFASAQNAAGVPTQVTNIYNKLLNGERLSEGQRKMFKGQSEGLLKAAGEHEKEIRKRIQNIANTYGLDPNNILPEAEINKSQQSKTITVDY